MPEHCISGVGVGLGVLEGGGLEAAVLRGGRGRVAGRRADADERVFVERPRTQIRRRPRR